ncbi:MAG: hypothetical protein EB168_06215 [Euryarchaeota archaeon]|nr:hypothetical protein [Euryarchaeota archaeon]
MFDNKTISSILIMIMAASVLSGCFGGSDEDVNTSLVDLQPASTSACPDGGILILVGLDEDNSGTLDADEVSVTRADGKDLVHCLAGDGAADELALVEYCPGSTTIRAYDSSYTWSLVGSFHSAPIGCDMGEDECEGYAEVPAYDATSQRAFVVNAEDSSVDIIDMSTPSTPTLHHRLIISNGEPNSVAVNSNGLVGVAVAVDPKQNNGLAMFFDVDGTLIGSVPAGALPDMITFTNDGTKALVANEGEPNDDYDIDPVGSVTIVDVSDTASLTATQVGFTSFNSQMATLEASGVRIFGPSATVAQDLEPEYIAVAGDDSTATIVMQENNAVATLDLSTNTITGIHALGFKDYSTMSFDLSDRDVIRSW